jgi:RNA polymerase sigma factor (sigma-70 family)
LALPLASDADLLARYTQLGDEAAFAALVSRHGPMVLSVCQQIVGDLPTAEDCFQAAFVVLARRAGSLRRPEALTAWLHGVALRVARKARSAARRRPEAPASTREAGDPRPDPLDALTARELLTILHEEVARLPEAYRLPVILCGLEGRSQEEAARQLGWSRGSVRGRWIRGRERLHLRLTRRGVTLGLALAVLQAARASGPLPASLAGAAVRSGGDPALPRNVALLAEGGLETALGKLRMAILVVLATGALATGLAVLPYPRSPVGPLVAGSAAPPAAEPGAERLAEPLPEGAVARLGTLRFRHGHQVSIMAFSRDGTVIASGGADRVVRFWDPATGRQIGILRGHDGSIYALAFSRDGKRVVTGGQDRTIRIWDVRTGKEEKRQKLDDFCTALAFSPDGKTLAWGSSSGSITLSDGTDFRGFANLSEHMDAVNSLAFTPDGRRLASGGRDGTVCVWDVTTADTPLKWKDPAGQKGRTVCDVAFSPDGKTLASAALSDPELRLHDADTGRLLRRLTGKWGFLSVRFLPDGASLVTGGQDGSVRLWNAHTGKEIRRLGDLKGWVHAVPSPDGQQVLGTHNQVLRLWEVRSGKELLPPAGHTGAVLSALSGDQKRAATADVNSGLIRLWDLSTGTELWHQDARVGMRNPPVFIPDGKGLITASSDGDVLLWDVAGGREVRRLETVPRLTEAVGVSPDGRWLVSLGGGGIHAWEIASGKPLPWSPLEAPKQRCVAFSPDGKLFATGDWDRVITLWNSTRGKKVRRLEGHRGSVYSVAFSPDGRTLASASCFNAFFAGAGQDDEIRLWDVDTGREIRRLGGHRGGYWQVAFSADGRTLVSAGEDGRVRLWELATGRERRSFAGHEGPVTAAALSRDGRRVLSGSVDTTALVQDTTGLAVRGRLPRLQLGAARLAGLWADLGREDAAVAYRAHWALVAGASDAVPFLRRELRPVPDVDRRRVARLVEALDADRFEAREEASRQLEAMGELVERELRAADRDGANFELRVRAKRLLEKLPGFRLAPERLRTLRAVEVLEAVGNAEARVVLESLAKGASEASLTREARRALDHLDREVSAAPPR